MIKKLLFGIIFCLPIHGWTSNEHINIARFSQGDLSGWKTKIFSGETHYSLKKINGRMALHAISSAAVSGRYREINIDLNKTPLLNWTWMVSNALSVSGINERTRRGDDYAARIYVIFSGGMLFWRTRAINYVWSSNLPINSHWPSAYTNNTQLIAVESGKKRLGQWVNQQRNVRKDYRRLFGEEPGNISAVAIMTDTDNTGATAAAWYGDIWFTAE